MTILLVILDESPCIGGKAPKMTGFSKFWGHIFAPSSQQSAGIALKTSPIESYQFSTSKLCTNFFSNSNQKIFFFGIKNIFRKKNRPKIFFGENPQNKKKMSENKISFFQKSYEIFFYPDFFLLELEKKLVHSFDVEKW